MGGWDMGGGAWALARGFPFLCPPVCAVAPRRRCCLCAQSLLDVSPRFPAVTFCGDGWGDRREVGLSWLGCGMMIGIYVVVLFVLSALCRLLAHGGCTQPSARFRVSLRACLYGCCDLQQPRSRHSRGTQGSWCCGGVPGSMPPFLVWPHRAWGCD